MTYNVYLNAKMKWFTCISLRTLVFILLYTDLKAATENYSWKPVSIGGGGFFTGVEFAPSLQDRIYIRSDVCGPWRRDSTSAPWTKCNSQIGDTSPHTTAPCAGLGVNPTNPDIAYGNFTDDFTPPDDIYKTTNAGKTWTRVFKNNSTGGDASGRLYGPGLAVDAQNGSVVYFRTKTNGLWRTLNDGSNWNQVLLQQPKETAFQSRSVAVDNSGPSLSGRSQYVYVTVTGVAIFRSIDGGNTFQAMANSPPTVRWLRVASDGVIYAASSAGVFTCPSPRTSPEVWSNVTPPSSNQCWGLATDPTNAARLVVNGTNSTGSWWIWKSINRGQSWVQTQFSLVAGTSWAKNFSKDILLNSGGLAIDPFNSNRVYLFSVFEILRTEDMWSSSSVSWQLDNNLAENVVPLNTISVPSSSGNTAPLYTGCSDVRGFRHANLDQPPTAYVEADDYSSTYVTGYAYSPSNPSFILACKTAYGANSVILNSTDGGKSWAQVNHPYPGINCDGGQIAISATNPKHWVYAPDGGQTVKYTDDGGTTWNTSSITKGSGSGGALVLAAASSAYLWDVVIAADKVNGNYFYAYQGTTGNRLFYVSSDGGATWQNVETTPGGQNAYGQAISQLPGPDGGNSSTTPGTVVTNPKVAGDVWVTASGNGLWHSTDFGSTFYRATAFQDRPGDDLGQFVSFGAPAPGTTTSTLFVYGYANGNYGFYRSIDSGSTWTQLLGNSPSRLCSLAADLQNYGRIFFGDSAAQGFSYGVSLNTGGGSDRKR